MSVNVRVSCRNKSLTTDPNVHTVITGIGGFVSNGERTRVWYEPEEEAIAYVKGHIYAFYVMTNGKMSHVTCSVVDGVERLTTDTDTSLHHALALLRMCSSPVGLQLNPTHIDDVGTDEFTRPGRPLNGFWHIAQATAV